MAEPSRLTRAKQDLCFQPERTLVHTPTVFDQCGWIGSGATRQQVRVFRVLVGKHARLMATAAAVLPDRALDSLRLRLFRQPRVSVG